MVLRGACDVDGDITTGDDKMDAAGSGVALCVFGYDK